MKKIINGHEYEFYKIEKEYYKELLAMATLLESIQEANVISIKDQKKVMKIWNNKRSVIYSMKDEQ